MVSEQGTGPDARVKIRLYSTESGGRQGPLPSKQFGCPVFFGEEPNQAFDCRFLVADVPRLEPGGPSATVPVKFLEPDLVRPFLRPGAKFRLWEGKPIGDGVVQEVFVLSGPGGRGA